MNPVYLDYAAATPVDSDVLEVMKPYFSDEFYNPSALYTGAREAKEALENARHSVAKTIGARPSEIVFTAGGTESANLAVRGVMERYPEAECITSSIEHDAVRAPAHRYSCIEVAVDKTGRVDLVSLEKSISDNTVLVSVMLVNNEIGTVQPIKEIVDLVHDIRRKRKMRKITLPLYVHTDACQAPNYLDIHVARLGIDMMTLNGGKIYGPKQSGILYVRTGVTLNPQILGGGQEFGVRSGTENVAFAVGFAHALENAVRNRSELMKDTTALQKYFVRELEKLGGELQGHGKLRVPNNILVTFSGSDNERVLFSLDEQGVWAASGSACSASNDEVSHVLTALGLSDVDARSSIRFSLGKHTTKAEIDKTIKALEIALKA